MHKTIEAVEVEGLANFAGNEGDAAMDRTIIAAHDIFGIALTGIPGHQAGTGIHCIVAVFAPTPPAMQGIEMHCIALHCTDLPVQCIALHCAFLMLKNLVSS